MFSLNLTDIYSVTFPIVEKDYDLEIVLLFTLIIYQVPHLDQIFEFKGDLGVGE